MSHASDTGFVTTTVANREEARQIARTLLAERLAACVQLVEIESHYIWKGEEKAEPEVMLLIKTRADLFEPHDRPHQGAAFLRDAGDRGPGFQRRLCALSCLDRGKHRLSGASKKPK